MYRLSGRTAVFLVTLFSVGSCSPATDQSDVARTADYEDLVALFTDWRAFQKPQLVDGVPDYSAAAMARQHDGLASYRDRLAAIDTAGWSIEQQVDYHLVRAEFNGLDFDHRVLRPWVNNPAFYVTVFPSESDQPEREGPHAWGNVEIWSYSFPLDPEDAAEIETRIGAIPGLVEQARANLTGNGSDLWIWGTARIREQVTALDQLASRLGDSDVGLTERAERARDATIAFATWLDEQAPSRTGSSGIGRDNYDWYLANVQMVPYTWQDEVTLMERELARSRSLLALEEIRNTGRPPQALVSSPDEHERSFAQALTEYMRFLADHHVLNMRDWMEPALRARLGRYSAGPREFFTEVNYRDPMVMRTHAYHWFDKARMVEDPHPSPIRRGPLLYNIFVSRTEGLATGWEETMLGAGMFDGRPRSRELIYILLAQRAARALGDLRMHSNEFTLEQAAEFASASTPRGWLSLDGNLVRWEQHLYLQQPGYGTSYVIGKIDVEKAMAERKQQLGESFALNDFMEELDAVGLIPTSLLRWQLAGELPGDVARMFER